MKWMNYNGDRCSVLVSASGRSLAFVYLRGKRYTSEVHGVSHTSKSEKEIKAVVAALVSMGKP